MDTFFEQLVAIKKTAKTWALFLLLWLAVVICIACCMLFLWKFIGVYVLLLVFGVLYGAYKLSLLLSVEYEYIITKRSVDIDKIIAQSSRKRIASFELSEVQSLEKYSPSSAQRGNFEKVIVACNPDDENAYALTVAMKSGGTMLVVYAPNEKMREATVKFLPKFIANSAFKD